MTHVRQQIRDALRDLLVAASLPGVGSQVYRTVYFPQSEAQLPLVTIYYDEDAEAIRAGTMTSDEREVHLIVEVVDVAAADVEDRLDAIGLAVEQAVGRDPKLGGVAMQGQITDTRFTRTTDADQEVATLQMLYAFRAMTAAGDPAQRAH